MKKFPERTIRIGEVESSNLCSRYIFNQFRIHRPTHTVGILVGEKNIVIKIGHAAFDHGLAQQLANHLKAPYYALSELKAESLYHAVKACPEQCRKDEMAKPMKK